MKSFAKKLIVFLSLALLVITAMLLGPNYVMNSKMNFKLDSDKTTLVLGHSQSQCSVNDSILNNSINLSNFGESYFYTYQKLKKVKEENAQINTVFLEFTNNHVDSIMDDWIWGHEKMSYFLQFYSPFIKFRDFKVLLKNNSTDIFTCYSGATRKQLFRMLRNDYYLIDDIGGFSYSNLSKIDELTADNDFNSSISKSQTISATNLNYLRKIIEFCRDKSIAIFLIRSPQHPLYADLSNEAVYQNVLKTEFSDVDMLDFDAMTFPQNYYLDFHHLNAYGSKQFTTLFNNLIKDKGLLNSAHKQSLIDESIIKFNKEQIKPSY